MPTAKQEGKNLKIYGVDHFVAADTLDCGQAFRWKADEDGCWRGIAHGRQLRLSADGDTLTLFDTTLDEYEKIWRGYFDIDRDYGGIISAISENRVLKEACAVAGGIRVLRQEPWETLCSFIISQNNNIPRIKGIIDRLCENFGDGIEGGFAFPSAERIAALSVDDLAPLRAGFRARYILDAARKMCDGTVDTERIDRSPLPEARAELMRICGVGEKVADCTLLFAFGKIDSFPKDVWIKRAMTVLFDGELPPEATPYAGIAQQYIFHYARITKLNI